MVPELSVPRIVPGRITDGRTVRVDRPGQELAPSPSRRYEERVESNGVAYVYIPTFGDPAMEERAVASLRANSDAPALIVDVRANGGGSTPTALIEALMDRPYRGFTEATSVTYGLFEAYAKIVRDNPPSAFNDYIRGYLDAFQGMGRAQMRMPAALVQSNDPIYTGPLFVLVDGGCASACEDFVMPLQFNGRASVIGERTSGSTGQPGNEPAGGEPSTGMKPGPAQAGTVVRQAHFCPLTRPESSVNIFGPLGNEEGCFLTMRRGREEVPRSANEEEYVRGPCGSFRRFQSFPGEAEAGSACGRMK